MNKHSLEIYSKLQKDTELLISKINSSIETKFGYFKVNSVHPFLEENYRVQLGISFPQLGYSPITYQSFFSVQIKVNEDLDEFIIEDCGCYYGEKDIVEKNLYDCLMKYLEYLHYVLEALSNNATKLYFMTKLVK